MDLPLQSEMTSLFEEHVRNYHRSGDQAYGLCPFHDDTTASFSINSSTGLWNCKGCSEKGNFFQFRDRIGFRSYTVKTPAPKLAEVTPVIKEIYPYVDVTGKTSYEILRMYPKSFRVRAPVEGGGWTYSLRGITTIPFNLNNMIVSNPVFLVEGEGKAKILNSKGLVATCTPFGASSWKSHYAEWFKHKNVIILPDNDTPGKKYAETAAADLVRQEGVSVKIVSLPVKEIGEDVKEYFNKYDGTIEELFDLIKAANRFVPTKDIPIEEWFYTNGINIPSSEGILPHEFKNKCNSVWQLCVERFNSLDDATFNFIDAIDLIWLEANTKDDYFRFLIALKKLIEYQGSIR